MSTAQRGAPRPKRRRSPGRTPTTCEGGPPSGDGTWTRTVSTAPRLQRGAALGRRKLRVLGQLRVLDRVPHGVEVAQVDDALVGVALEAPHGRHPRLAGVDLADDAEQLA